MALYPFEGGEFGEEVVVSDEFRIDEVNESEGVLNESQNSSGSG